MEAEQLGKNGNPESGASGIGGVLSQETIQALWYWGSTAVLGLLLYYPVTRLVWVMRVRRFERKTGQKSTEEDRQRHLRQARFISILIVMLFAFLYTRTLISPP